MFKASRCLLGALLLLMVPGVAGCDNAGLGPFLRLLPVDQRGLQLRADPPAPELASPPQGTGGALVVGAGSSGAGQGSGLPAGPVVQPTAQPTAAPTPSPLDLLGCEALASTQIVTSTAVLVTGPTTPTLEPEVQGPWPASAMVGKRYEVSLPTGSGVIAVKLTESTGFNVFVNKALTVTVSDGSGLMRQVRGQRPMASCGDLAHRFPLAMPKGTSFIRFAGSDSVAVAFVPVTN